MGSRLSEDAGDIEEGGEGFEGEEGLVKKHDCWAVASSDDGEVVVGGFSNGDVRMFDLRQPKGCLWGAELPGGIASLSLD